MKQVDQPRRNFIRHLALAPLSLAALPTFAANQDDFNLRKIPRTNRFIPVVGMGSWLTFDINPTENGLKTRIEILKTFFQMGGTVIDSSPMYGRSEKVLGKCLEALGNPQQSFPITKVWTSGKHQGIRQMHNSEKLWNVKRFSLMQIHNLVDWQTHMETLIEWKAQNKVEYIGVTTYGGLDHHQIEHIMKSYPIDFVQLTYNILDRKAEQRLLPLAIDKGIGVIANRPFREGKLFDYVVKQPLPSWAEDYHCRNWAQLFLKYILAHPAVTCAIPATSQVAHMRENMGALKGAIPSLSEQRKIASHFEQLI